MGLERFAGLSLTPPRVVAGPLERAALYHLYGRGARIRTGDLLRPRQARYQAAPRPDEARRQVLVLGVRGALEPNTYTWYLEPDTEKLLFSFCQACAIVSTKK